MAHTGDAQPPVGRRDFGATTEGHTVNIAIPVSSTPSSTLEQFFMVSRVFNPRELIDRSKSTSQSLTSPSTLCSRWSRLKQLPQPQALGSGGAPHIQVLGVELAPPKLHRLLRN